MLPQVSVPLNPAYLYYSYCDPDSPNLPPPNEGVKWWWEHCPPIIPTNDTRVVKKVPGCAPEQVHLMWYGSDGGSGGAASVLVSWATCGDEWTQEPNAAALPAGDATSIVRLGRAPGVWTRRVGGVATSYTAAFDGGGTYVSPLIHHALARGLEPGKWFYKIEDSKQLADIPAGRTPFFGSFTVRGPGPAAFPFTFGLLGDPGQVTNTSLSLAIVEAAEPDLVILTGDLAYADSIKDNPKGGPASEASPLVFWEAFGKKMNFYGPRWDTFGRLVSPLLSRVPFLATDGNHDAPLGELCVVLFSGGRERLEEDEKKTPVPSLTSPPRHLPFPDSTPYNTPFYAKKAKGSCTNFGCDFTFTARQLNYNARFPLPQTEEIRAHGPTLASLGPIVAAEPATYTRNAWQRTEVAGVATIITLSEYIPYDDSSADSDQYRWLYGELTENPVDRKRTPWLIVLTHAPWYASYTKHWLEAECYRKTYEPLLLWAGVDAMIEGHDHAYERSYPAADWRVDTECGIPHFSVGDAGADDLTITYIDEMLNKTSPLGYGSALFCSGPGVQSDVEYWPVAYAPQAPGQYGPAGWCTPPADIMCPDGQPAVSAYREQVYGAAALKVLSPEMVSKREDGLREAPPAPAQRSLSSLPIHTCSLWSALHVPVPPHNPPPHPHRPSSPGPPTRTRSHRPTRSSSSGRTPARNCAR